MTIVMKFSIEIDISQFYGAVIDKKRNVYCMRKKTYVTENILKYISKRVNVNSKKSECERKDVRISERGVNFSSKKKKI